jgi:hypothetical protein
MKTHSISNPVSGNVLSISGLRHAVTVALVLLTMVAFAQTTPVPNQVQVDQVSGVVRLAQDNTPLVGVNIYLKGTTTGTFSDAEGKFIFPQKLIEGEILIFSFVGLIKQELIITASMPAVVEIRMEEDAIDILDELWIEKPERTKSKRRNSGD